MSKFRSVITLPMLLERQIHAFQHSFNKLSTKQCIVSTTKNCASFYRVFVDFWS